MREVRLDFSTITAPTAPRLRDSRDNAPAPPNNSSTVAPSTLPPRLLKMACLTRSGVGRTSYPFGTLRIRPPDLPPMIRMLKSGSGLPLDEHPNLFEGHADQ